MSKGEFSTDAKDPLPEDSEASGEDTALAEAEGTSGAGESSEKSEVQELPELDGEALKELKKRAEERDAYRDELLRAKAELDNYQKRVRRERPNWEDHAVRQFLREILIVVDNFELAMGSDAPASSDAESSLRQGIQMIYQQLQKTLEASGVEEVEALGEFFNPEFHEAIAEVEVPDKETGCVVDVQMKGFLYKGVLVRPSRVLVARKRDEKEEQQEDQGET